MRVYTLISLGTGSGTAARAELSKVAVSVFFLNSV